MEGIFLRVMFGVELALVHIWFGLGLGLQWIGAGLLWAGSGCGLLCVGLGLVWNCFRCTLWLVCVCFGLDLLWFGFALA